MRRWVLRASSIGVSATVLFGGIVIPGIATPIVHAGFTDTAVGILEGRLRIDDGDTTQPHNLSISVSGSNFVVEEKGANGLVLMVNPIASGGCTLVTSVKITCPKTTPAAVDVVMAPAIDIQTVTVLSGIRADFSGSSTADYFQGSSAADIIRGNGGNDALYGGGGMDQIYGGDGDDFIYGEDDSDQLYGGRGGDIFDGGSGNDLVSYLSREGFEDWRTKGVLASLDGKRNDGSEDDGEDRDWIRAGVENLVGSEKDDVLIGDDKANTLIGFAGNDTIVGGKGNDSIRGHAGIDRIYINDNEVDTDVNCNNSDESRGTGPNYLYYDAADVLAGKVNGTDCSIRQGLTVGQGPILAPYNTASPFLSSSAIAVNQKINVDSGKWNGAGIVYSYEWQSCADKANATADCAMRANGKATSYTVQQKDLGRRIRVVVTASNAGGSVSQATDLTFPVDKGGKFTVPNLAPERLGGLYFFTKEEAVAAIMEEANGLPLRIVFVGKKKSSIDSSYRATIEDGEVYQVSPGGGTKLTSTPDNPAVITLKFYDLNEDLENCPPEDEITTYNSTWANEPFTRIAEKLRAGTCPWRAEWLDEDSKFPYMTIGTMRYEDTYTLEGIVRTLIVPMRKPRQLRLNDKTTAADLMLSISAPAPSVVAVDMERPTIDVFGMINAFDTPVNTAFNVLTTQASTNTGVGFSKLMLFDTDGTLVSTIDQGTSHSLMIGHAFKSAGVARVVSSVVAPIGNTGAAVVREVFADIEVREATGFVAMDGRCFDSAGTLDPECNSPDISSADFDMADVIKRSYVSLGVSALNAYADGKDALVAARDLGLAFSLDVVDRLYTTDPNRLVPTRTQHRQVSFGLIRAAGCAWYDLVCWGQSLASYLGSITVKNPKKKAKPITAEAKIDTLNVDPTSLRPSVSNGSCSQYAPTAFACPGALTVNPTRLINLDASGLINLDGGGLVNPDPSGLINLDGGGAVKVDRSALINLDAGNLISNGLRALAGDVYVLKSPTGLPLIRIEPDKIILLESAGVKGTDGKAISNPVGLPVTNGVSKGKMVTPVIRRR